VVRSDKCDGGAVHGFQSSYHGDGFNFWWVNKDCLESFDDVFGGWDDWFALEIDIPKSFFLYVSNF